MLTIILKKFENKTLHILAGFTILSFLSNVIFVFINPQIPFYFPICRFWEMSIGGLIAYTNFSIYNQRINNIVSAGSVMIILITIWIVN